MWKSIVLCVSLFGGAALGLGLGARYVEPAALPAAAAIGLCVIGIVLILAAPTSEATLVHDEAAPLPAAQPVPAAVEPVELPPVVARNRTPTIPFEALNS
jgi:hypothetical protein